MKRSGILLGLIALLAGPAQAADDAVTRAMKLLEKHRYEDAARDLKAEMASLDREKQASAQLTLGMIYLRNAELHHELYQASAIVNLDYLKRLAAGGGKSRSRFSDLYLGKALIENGKPEAATQPLERFIAAEGGEPKYKAVAKVNLGLSAHLRGDKQKAQEIWTGIDATAPEVKTELAAAYSRAGLAEKNPVALCDEALAIVKKGGGPLSIQAVSNALGVYARAGQLEKGFDLLKRSDPKSFSYKETLGKSKIISFYELPLLANLSTFYLQAGLASLEKAAVDPQLKGTASYYLGEAYSLAGNADQSMKATAAFLSTTQAPPQYKNKAMVRQAGNQYQKGHQSDAYGMWTDLTRMQANDPELLADILVTCGRLGIECPRMAESSVAAAEKGEGKRFSLLNIGIGRYYLSRKNYAKAVSYLEAGRDKGNKNKIESNDPLMLVKLSDAYYRTRKFSEALEIYFEMSRQFPQVRQIQEALQGVYSMEHKSAGDVKIN